MAEIGLHFWAIDGRITHIELRTAGAVDRSMRKWVIGKQVKVLCDLVTVSQERMMDVMYSH